LPALMRNVLILGGTADAFSLANALNESRTCRVILSLAGRTKAPRTGQFETRIGGFGGIAGLCSFIASAPIHMVIDATHPFAVRISQNSAAACIHSKIPHLVFLRPPWTEIATDQWHHVPSETAAADALPQKARAFLTLGSQYLAPFSKKTDAWFLLRMIDLPRCTSLICPHLVITGRGPFTLENEMALMEQHSITHLVTRNAGGQATFAKLQAARKLRCSVIMIDRPTPFPTPTVSTLADALQWVIAECP